MASSKRKSNSSDSSQAQREEELEELKDSLYQLEFEVKRSLRYHSKRRTFFDGLQNFTSALSAVFGSAAFAGLMSNNTQFTPWLAALIAILSTFNLVIRFSERSRIYDGLYKKFSDLLTKILRDEVTTKSLAKLQAEKAEIEKDEPSLHNVLNVVCHNEEARAQGINEEIYDISGLHRLFMHIFLFNDFAPNKATVNNIILPPHSDT